MPSSWGSAPSLRRAGSARSLGDWQKTLHGSSGEHRNDYSVLLLASDHSTDAHCTFRKTNRKCQGVNMWTWGRITRPSTSRGAASKRGSSAQDTFAWAVKKGSFQIEEVIKWNLLAQACFPRPRRSLSPILCSHKGQSKWLLLLGERWTTLLKYKYLPQQMEDGEVDLSSLGWKSQTLAEMTSIEQGDLSYSSINSLSIALESKAKKACVWTKPV